MTSQVANADSFRRGRREFLQTVGTGAIALAFADAGFAAGGKLCAACFPSDRHPVRPTTNWI